mgnify:CR=1 FL=1
MMGAFLRAMDEFLRGRGRFAVEAPLAGRLRWLFAFVLAGGIFYGAVMGSFSGLAPGRFHQLVYSGVKVPILLLVTFGLCLPSFFVINSVAGLRDDFGQVLQAIVGTQACVTLVLAALAPVTALLYGSCADYAVAVFVNGVMFATAAATAQIVVRRYYAPLVSRNARHRTMLHVWLGLYVFVGIQMAWVLRPFIGDPDRPVVFFRADAWGNAYVVVAQLIRHTLNAVFPF